MMRSLKAKTLLRLRNKKSGTKFSPVYKMKIPAGETKTIYCRLSNKDMDNAFVSGFRKNIYKHAKKKPMIIMQPSCQKV